MRDLAVNDRPTNVPRGFQSNYIKTTKYNFFSFLPLSILFQFKRFANCYFLLVTVLCCFPSVSPFAPISAIAPFVFVIFVSVIREGVEDFMRYRSDRGKGSPIIDRDQLIASRAAD